MMPIKQQYFIASAIIGLIAVMVIFAMFDYFSDRSRYAEQMTGAPQGAVALAGAPYSAAPMNAPGYGQYLCRGCGVMTAGPGSAFCQGCRAYLGNSSASVPQPGLQTAGSTWFGRQQQQNSEPQGILYCPMCDFSMGSRHTATPNSIRCPRCPAYLFSSGAGTGSATGLPGAGQQAAWSPNCPPAYTPAYPAPVLQSGPYGLGGQQAAFAPGQGQGQGRGLNPFCPIR